MNPTLLEKLLSNSNAIEGVTDNVSLVQAVQAWDYLRNKKVMKPKYIIKAHKILMEDHLIKSELGHFRDCDVMVGGYVAPHHTEVFSKMLVWCHNINQEKSDPIFDHVAFEKIHPFVDGNGRIGRLLLNWQSVIKLKQKPIIFLNKEKYDVYYKLFL